MTTAPPASRWTTAPDLVAKVRRRWDDGTLLSALASGAPCPALDLPVRGPRPSEIGADLAAVQHWIAELEAGSRGGRRYELAYGEIGGRAFGRNRVPTRARISTYEQAWALLGVGSQVEAYQRLLAASAAAPPVRAWAAANPLSALETAEEWEAVVAAYLWLDGARGSGLYLRQITAPGVDTKFVERHRSLLARLLGVERSGPGFIAGLGLRAKPDLVNLRVAPGVLGLPGELSEGAFQAGELARVPATIRTAVVVENEATYRSVPVPDDGVVLWGKGFEVDRVGVLSWLRDAEIFYWGDLDSHGFAILDRLRAWLPRTRSFLMDRQTLLQHRGRWGSDPTPTSARLTRLDAAESALYEDLVTDRLGESVRLEQERIDWAWARERLPY